MQKKGIEKVEQELLFALNSEWSTRNQIATLKDLAHGTMLAINSFRELLKEKNVPVV